jgi:hypothetical protein
MGEPGERSRLMQEETVTDQLGRLSRVVSEMRAEGFAVPEIDPALIDEAVRRGVWDEDPPPAVMIADASRDGAWEADDGQR